MRFPNRQQNSPCNKGKMAAAIWPSDMDGMMMNRHKRKKAAI